MMLSLNIRFWEYDFFAPQWLWLALLTPIVWLLLARAEKKHSGELKFTGTNTQQQLLASKRIVLIRQGIILLLAFLPFFLAIAMAKPYNWNDHITSNKDYKDGIDIILTIDISGSMLEMDFKPNRIEAAKAVAKEFVDGRNGDRIGLVAFAGEAYTACPATLDYNVLKKQIDALDCYANIEGGTAIGVGLGTAVTRLRNDRIPSKVIILLTDGSNNAGAISPDEAADLAVAKNVRVYTIGVGAPTGSTVTVNTPFGSMQRPVDADLDETTLKNIATKTGAKYFRATDNESLKAIYAEIEQMEKRKMIDRHFQSEPPAMPLSFLQVALLLAVIGWVAPRILFKQHD